MNQACAAVGNRDIEKFVPALITAMANPTEVPETVHKLSATTFVQAVEAPALSIMVPLLVRGLRERQTAIKRKSAVIIDNMSKLVDNPADAAVFLPRLVPATPSALQYAAVIPELFLSTGAASALQYSLPAVNAVQFHTPGIIAVCKVPNSHLAVLVSL